MADIKDVGVYFTSKAFIASLIVVSVTVVLLIVIKKYLIKKVAYTTKSEQHQNTFIGVIFSILQYAVVLGCIIIVMQLHGVNVTSIVAGLGIVGALVGLALQDTMKDIISGINIYNNNFYKVGDLVKYNGEICDVKYFSARVTKFQSVASHSTYTVCNSTINSIEKIKDITPILLNFDFEDDKKKVDKCFKAACDAVRNEPYVKGVDYPGIVDITHDGLVYAAVITVPGHKSLPVKFKFLNALYEECLKCNVSPSFSDEHKIKQIK